VSEVPLEAISRVVTADEHMHVMCEREGQLLVHVHGCHIRKGDHLYTKMHRFRDVMVCPTHGMC